MLFPVTLSRTPAGRDRARRPFRLATTLSLLILGCLPAGSAISDEQSGPWSTIPVSAALAWTSPAAATPIADAGGAFSLPAAPSRSGGTGSAEIAPPRNGGSRRRMNVQSIPIIMSVPSSPITGGTGSVSVQLTVDQVPSEGSSVQVSTDHPEILVSPGGSWPYHLFYAGGSSTTQSFTVNTNTVTANTTVHIYACEEGVDITNSNNWRVVGTVTITPQGTPGGGG